VARASHPRYLPGEDLSPAPRRRVVDRPARGPAGVTAIGRIVIPKIGKNVTVYEGTSLKVLAYGPGHWHGKAMPGKQGNALFSGHRVTETRPFYDIDKLRDGDQIIYEMKDGKHVYEVYDYFVISPDEWWVADDGDDWITTIMACHPKHSARQRYVVRGRLVSRPTPKPTPAPDPTPKPNKGLLPL
jgi:sortase A